MSFTIHWDAQEAYVGDRINYLMWAGMPEGNQ